MESNLDVLGQQLRTLTDIHGTLQHWAASGSADASQLGGSLGGSFAGSVLEWNIYNFAQQVLTVTEALQDELKLVLAQSDWNGDDRGLGGEHGHNEEHEAPRYVDLEVGMAMLIALTREKIETAINALLDIDEQEGTTEKFQKLSRVLQIMERPAVTEIDIAEAYTMLLDARIATPQLCEKQCKAASIALRDLLVVHMCCVRGTMTREELDRAFDAAFQGALSSVRRSQFHLAAAAICSLASEADFTMQFEKKIQTRLSPEDSTALYDVYTTAKASLITDYLSVKSKKPKRKAKLEAIRDAKPDAIPATAIAFADSTEPLRVPAVSAADPMIYIHKCYKCGSESYWCINAELQGASEV